uniref:F-box domain-containing protein n=1 Tax=Acrobeloides nanus TaxID=290746 RepID=A0A914DZ76_9BILA
MESNKENAIFVAPEVLNDVFQYLNGFEVQKGLIVSIRWNWIITLNQGTLPKLRICHKKYRIGDQYEMSRQEKSDLAHMQNCIIPWVELETVRQDYQQRQIPVKFLLGLQQRMLYTKMPMLVTECIIHATNPLQSCQNFFADLCKALRHFIKVQRLVIHLTGVNLGKDGMNLKEVMGRPNFRLPYHPKEVVLHLNIDDLDTRTIVTWLGSDRWVSESTKKKILNLESCQRDDFIEEYIKYFSKSTRPQYMFETVTYKIGMSTALPKKLLENFGFIKLFPDQTPLIEELENDIQICEIIDNSKKEIDAYVLKKSNGWYMKVSKRQGGEIESYLNDCYVYIDVFLSV